MWDSLQEDWDSLKISWDESPYVWPPIIPPPDAHIRRFDPPSKVVQVVRAPFFWKGQTYIHAQQLSMSALEYSNNRDYVEEVSGFDI